MKNIINIYDYYVWDEQKKSYVLYESVTDNIIQNNCELEYHTHTFVKFKDKNSKNT